MRILIITEESDASTQDVSDWIEYLGHSVFRVNKEDEIKDISIEIIENEFAISLHLERETVELHKVDSVWYRRGEVQLSCNIDFPKMGDEIDFYNAVGRHLYHEERNSLEIFINSYLQHSKPHIGYYGSKQFNKFIALQKAIEVGLIVPNTCVTTKKNSCVIFFRTTIRLYFQGNPRYFIIWYRK